MRDTRLAFFFFFFFFPAVTLKTKIFSAGWTMDWGGVAEMAWGVTR